MHLLPCLFLHESLLTDCCLMSGVGSGGQRDVDSCLTRTTPGAGGRGGSIPALFGLSGRTRPCLRCAQSDHVNLSPVLHRSIHSDMQGCKLAIFRLRADHYCPALCLFRLLVPAQLLSATQPCRKEGEKTTPFGVSLMRSQVSYWAAQGTQPCTQALRVLTGVFCDCDFSDFRDCDFCDCDFCDCADLLPQVLLAFPHAVARRHAQGHHNLAVSQR